MKTLITKISGNSIENDDYNLFSSRFYNEFLKIRRIEDLLTIENFDKFILEYENYIMELELTKQVIVFTIFLLIKYTLISFEWFYENIITIYF